MKMIVGVLLFAIIQIIFTERAYAYIDPGTGSMMIQALLALIATVSVSIGVFWKRIRSFFMRLLNKDKSN